jgi:hypothetical protein
MADESLGEIKTTEIAMKAASIGNHDDDAEAGTHSRSSRSRVVRSTSDSRERRQTHRSQLPQPATFRTALLRRPRSGSLRR